MRLWILFLVAGCVPNKEYDFDLQERTQALLYLLIPRCQGGTDLDARGGCKAGDEEEIQIYARSRDDGLNLNLGEEDRVFAAEYAYPEDMLGIPKEVKVVPDLACPAREFPPPLASWRIDVSRGFEQIPEFPSEWLLPEFDHRGCYDIGGCLARPDEDGVPSCQMQCEAAAPMAPVIDDVAPLPDLSSGVTDCPKGWFNLETNACVEPSVSCDAFGWPATRPAGSVFVDPLWTGPAEGTEKRPFPRIDDARASQAPVLLLKAGIAHQVSSPIDWDVELIGCVSAGAKSEIGLRQLDRPALRIESNVIASSIAFVSQVEVISGRLDLSSSTIELGTERRVGLSVSDAMVTLTGVAIQSSTTAIAVKNGTLAATTLDVTGAAGIRAVDSAIDLSNSVIHRILTGTVATGLAARGLSVYGGSVTLNRVAVDLTCHRAINLVDTTATFEDVQVSRFGKHTELMRQIDCNDEPGISGEAPRGIHVWNASNLLATRLRVGSEEPVRGDGVVARADSTTRTMVRLVDSRISNVGVGLRAFDANVVLENVGIEGVAGGGVRLISTIGELNRVKISGAPPLLDLKSVTVTGGGIDLASDPGAPAVELEYAEACAPPRRCGDSSVDLSDLRIIAVSGDVGLRARSLSPDPTERIHLSRVELTGFDESVEIEGGLIDLEHFRIAPNVDRPAFDIRTANEAGQPRPVRLSLTQVLIVGGNGIVAPSDPALSISASETTFQDATRLLELSGDCLPNFPNELLHGISATLVGNAKPVLYPGQTEQ